MRTPEEQAIGTAVIGLMSGVVYREADETRWAALGRHAGPVRDHFTAIGVDVVIDDVEGYAYLRTREPEDGEDPLPRLVKRRALTYNVSLLLVLLRKRLAEFEATGGEGRLVLSGEQIVEMLRVFLASSTNEARVLDQAARTIGKVKDLGFVRELRGQKDLWEVRRVLKAYVDGQTMGFLDAKLTEYAKAEDAKTEDANAPTEGAADD